MRTTKRQRRDLIGEPIATRIGRGRIVGWSGHGDPWPLVKLARDPYYFGPLCIQSAAALEESLGRLQRRQALKARRKARRAKIEHRNTGD